MARIAVFGLGYVGCTTSIGFAELGHSVIGCDISDLKIQSLSRGIVPIFEHGLEDSLQKSLVSKGIEFTLESGKALKNADFVFLCVPTPMNPDGSADLHYLESALDEIQSDLEPETIIVLKSTLPLGTGENIRKRFQEFENSIVYNPEFLREGTALSDFRNPDRIILGSDSDNAARQTSNLYKGIDAPVLITGFGEAELIKYASNAFLAVKISFINEISHLALNTGINIVEVASGMGMDKRIGEKFLSPGPGWGGSCFPKDSRELVTTASKNNVELRVLEAAITANEDAKNRVVEFATQVLGGDLSNKKITILGLAFKANTDDVRDSPAMAVASKLIAEGAHLKAFDPAVKRLDSQDLELAHSVKEACKGAELLIIMTEWLEFAELEPKEIFLEMASPNVIDTRNILKNRDWENLSSQFLSLGGRS